MKEKLTRNLGLKVLSIILAAMLWLVITNVDDPITTKYFDDVAVSILNDVEVKKLGYDYDIIEGETIDFTVAARRSIADNLTVSDFRVTADFSKLSDVNATTINIYCPRYGDQVTVTDGLYQVMKINLEELVEKQFKINVVQKGEPAQGYYVAKKTATPMMIRVSGPKSKIERIEEVIVEVDVTDLSVPFNTTVEPIVKDKEGNEIDASKLKFSSKSVAVSIDMYNTKMVKLLIETEGIPADGYIKTAVEYEPKEIEVAGPDEALRAIESITITEDITGAKQNIEKEINIQEYLKDGLVQTGENQTVAVNIAIEKTQTKDIQIRPSDIDIRNKPSGLQSALLTIGPVTVKVEGASKVLKEITAKSLKPYIDLSSYKSGIYDVLIRTELPENTKVSNTPLVSIRLTE